MTKSTFTFNQYILVFILVLMFGAIRAQSLTLDWVKSTIAHESVWASQMVFDREGNILVTGTFEGAPDFGFGSDTIILNSNGGLDGFVLKLTSTGIPLWVKAIGGASLDGASSIETDTLNSIYITGLFRDSVDFDPDGSSFFLTGNSNGDGYILKLTEDGNFEWVKSSPQSISIAKIGLSNDNHFYITGSYRDTSDLDFGSSVYSLSSDYSTGFLGKYDFDFNLIWIDTVSNYFYESGADFSIDPDENVVYSVVKQYGTILRKLDNNGTIIWQKKFTGNIETSDITTDQSGNILVCGTFEGNVDFDPGTGTHIFPFYYGDNGFVLKLDENGDFDWAANVSSGGTDHCDGVATDSFNNVYVGGIYQSAVDFDPTTASNLMYPVNPTGNLGDVFIWKLDSLGNLVTVKTFGGDDSDSPINLLIDSAGSIYNFGLYSGFSNDFSPGSSVVSFPNPGGLAARYLIKFNPCQTILGHIDSLNICDSIQWLNGITYYSNSTNSGTYNFISSTSDGCDSIVGLYLNVRYSTTNIDTVFSCDPYTWIDGITYNYSTQLPTYLIQNAAGCDSSNFLRLVVEYIPLGLMHSLTDNTITTNAAGLSYRWLDCNNGMSVIPNETSQSFTPTANGSYAAEITKNGCIDTTDCMLITTVGIDENTTQNVKLYPNPTKGSFTLQFEQDQHDAEINLFSITGQLKESRKIHHAAKTSFELNYPNGIYLLEIVDQNNKKTILKLIKE